METTQQHCPVGSYEQARAIALLAMRENSETKEEVLKQYAPIGDMDNPRMLAQTFPHRLLSAIAKGEVDFKKTAMNELRMRGLDIDGNWVGFNQQ